MGAASVPSALPQEVRDTARLWNFDAYLAATLAPADRQADLIALAAYVGELERIVRTISEPTLAQIRVQWWRDELQRLAGGEVSDHPIGVALADAVAHCDWPIGLLVGIADAVADQLSDAEYSDMQMLNAWVGKRYGAPLDLATRYAGHVLSGDVCNGAGRAYGLAVLASRAQSEQHTEHDLEPLLSSVNLRTESVATLEQVVPMLQTLPRASRAGLLPLSLVRLYVRATPVEPGRLAKVMRFAGAHWFSRF